MERTVQNVLNKVDAILNDKPHLSAACALWCALNDDKPGDACSGEYRKCMFDSIISMDRLSSQEKREQKEQEKAQMKAEEQETKDTKSIRQEVLQAAIETVCHDREDQYGNPENNFEAIANFWNVYLNTKHGLAENNKLVKFIEADDVAAMMMLLKIARIATGAPKRDNWVDSAGYAGCGAEIQESKVSDNA